MAKELGVSIQRTQVITSKAIEKVFKKTRTTYNLSYLDTLEMLFVGLDIYKDDGMVNYFMKNLSKKDLINIEIERKKHV